MVNDVSDDALSEREQLLLRVLVGSYIRDGQPVGSRSLSRESGLALSSATIRNIVADLESLGFVQLAAHLGRHAFPPTRVIASSSTRC